MEKVIFLLIGLSLIYYCNSTRMYMDECNKNGFKCFNANATWLTVMLTCDTFYTEQDIEISLYDFRAVPDLNELIIQNCRSVKLNMTCSLTPTNLQKLTVVNVSTLILQESKNQQNPREVVFLNVRYIPEIPHHFFVHTSKGIGNQCEFSNADLANVTMKSVNVGVIRSGAFFNLRNMRELKFSFCNIFKVEPKAIDVQLTPQGKFISRDSAFYDLDDNGIHVLGLKLFTADDDYTQISSVDENTICLVNLP